MYIQEIYIIAKNDINRKGFQFLYKKKSILFHCKILRFHCDLFTYFFLKEYSKKYLHFFV